MKQKEIKKFVDDIEDLLFYLNAPSNPLGPRGEGAQQCFCVEAHHLFKDIKKKLNKLEDKLLAHYGYDKKSIELLDYLDD